MSLHQTLSLGGTPKTPHKTTLPLITHTDIDESQFQVQNDQQPSRKGSNDPHNNPATDRGRVADQVEQLKRRSRPLVLADQKEAGRL